MERVVSVTGTNENEPDSSESRFDPHPMATDWPEIPGTPDDDTGETAEIDSPLRPNIGSGSWGTCLYFGPGGERCSRPADASGFCSRHRGGVEVRAVKTGSPAKQNRILAAIFALLGILWSVLSPLMHALLHWIHSH
jgi:hypothetical protein